MSDPQVASKRFTTLSDVVAHLQTGGDEAGRFGQDAAALATLLREPKKVSASLTSSGELLVLKDGASWVVHHCRTGRRVLSGGRDKIKTRRSALVKAAALESWRDGNGVGIDWVSPGLSERAKSSQFQDALREARELGDQNDVLDAQQAAATRAQRVVDRIPKPANQVASGGHFVDTEALRAHFRKGGHESFPEGQRSYLRQLAEADIAISPNGDWVLIQHGRGNWQIAPAGCVLRLQSESVGIGSVGSKAAALKLAQWLSEKVTLNDGTPVDWSDSFVNRRVGDLRAFDNEGLLALLAARAKFDEREGVKISFAIEAFKRVGVFKTRDQAPAGQIYTDQLEVGDALVINRDALARITSIEKSAGHYTIVTANGSKHSNRNALIEARKEVELVVTNEGGERVGQLMSQGDLRVGDNVSFVISGERLDPTNRRNWRHHNEIHVTATVAPTRDNRNFRARLDNVMAHTGSQPWDGRVLVSGQTLVDVWLPSQVVRVDPVTPRVAIATEAAKDSPPQPDPVERGSRRAKTAPEPTLF